MDLATLSVRRYGRAGGMIGTVRKGSDRVATGRYRAAMDLLGWIAADVASVRTKLFDTIMGLVPPECWHEQADGGGSTIAGLLLHLSRHQDLALNTVIAGRAPLFAGHRDALGLASASTAAGLAERESRELTTAVTTDALTTYVTAVFDSTEAFLGGGDVDFEAVPDLDGRLRDRAALDVDEVPWLFNMWRGKPAWWLLQWPVVGHGHTHAGEAVSIRNRMGYSPF